jgi:hypothetical protein
MLHRLGAAQVAVAGGNDLENAVATPTASGGSVLVWRYPQTPDATPETRNVEIALPPGHSGAVQLFRLGAAENSIVERWRAMGAPAYPTPRQLADLKAQDRLQPARDLTVSGGVARFALERPGVALLEVG